MKYRLLANKRKPQKYARLMKGYASISRKELETVYVGDTPFKCKIKPFGKTVCGRKIVAVTTTEGPIKNSTRYFVSSPDCEIGPSVHRTFAIAPAE